jgi:citrate lyase subunit beta/citryl-CoA lyase
LIARSYLFAPGNREDLLDKVFAAGADAIVLDLEDAVPLAHKAHARELVASAIDRRVGRQGPSAFVRINALATELWQADVSAIVRPGVTGLRVAKAESPVDVANLDQWVSRLEGERGMASGTIELTLAIESAVGVERATELAASSPRVKNLCFGAADFCADVGVDPSQLGYETLFAQSRIVVSSRVAGLDPPIASVHTDLSDDRGLRETSEAARRLGYCGRSCVHPRQVATVNGVFTPGPETIERARRLIHSYESALAHGLGATTAAGGEFVDPAVLRRARAVLALAARFVQTESA